MKAHGASAIAKWIASANENALCEALVTVTRYNNDDGHVAKALGWIHRKLEPEIEEAVKPAVPGPHCSDATAA